MLTLQELSTLKRLLASYLEADLALAIDICVANKSQDRVRIAYVNALFQYQHKALYRTREENMLFRMLRERYKEVLTTDECRRYENKVAGRVIGLADTLGNVVIGES